MWTQIRGNKYGASKKVYNGRLYMSKKEAGYAQELELRKRAKDIKDYTPQYRIDLNVNGYHICNYYVDFLVINNDDTKEFHEVKGFRTSTWELKWKLTEALYSEEYKMVLIT